MMAKDPANEVLARTSFLYGGNAAFIEDLAERLRDTGYEVWTTPFGWFCEWDLAVRGESLAKVWKEV